MFEKRGCRQYSSKPCVYLSMFPYRPLISSSFFLSKQSLARLPFIRTYCEATNREANSTLDPKDRSRVISVETSIRYLKSKAFKETYRGELIWKLYRRNHKGALPPDTRQTCIRKNRITTGSPCPICRDEYLVIDYRNTDLLKQFIGESGGNILTTKKTGVCQKQHKKIQVEIMKAWNYVIGGGIAGVSCIETLTFLKEDADILLITQSEIVKTVTSAVQLSRTIMELDVNEVALSKIREQYPNVEILLDTVTKFNYAEKSIETNKNIKVFFKKLCICTGGKAKLIEDNNPFIIGIRDTDSVFEFEKKIKSSKRLMIVGNGGIASEIIHEVQGIEKIWVVKDNHISKTFIDAGAGEFFQGCLDKDNRPATSIKRITYTTGKSTNCLQSKIKVTNPALGPDWHKNYDLHGYLESSKVVTEFNAEVSKILNGDENWPIYVELSNEKVYGVDFVVSATGVVPNVEPFASSSPDLKLGIDGGILVDWKMETSLTDVFAAGDVCTAGWNWAPQWHQMRLWTQAKQMGSYCAKCLLASITQETILQDFCFEIFTHVTKLYGFKVVLLGLFNGQKLGGEYELLLRVTKGQEYVKLVIKNGKLQGALLIGETDLEEMCENLILNQLDVTPFGEELLNPDVDIEDYFD
ncbi:hypothetical protein RUM43_014933 [Polyplax serrata]|uniref:Pyridine nucleotide-disulfide oxidoreductase domain-containing protein 1 n=1 Tax=Polyplax serrata TaxID=468196 RepID=A0AAN8S6I2_POLSC